VNRRIQTLVAALRSPAQGARASLLLQRSGKGQVNKRSDGVKGRAVGEVPGRRLHRRAGRVGARVKLGQPAPGGSSPHAPTAKTAFALPALPIQYGVLTWLARTASGSPCSARAARKEAPAWGSTISHWQCCQCSPPRFTSICKSSASTARHPFHFPVLRPRAECACTFPQHQESRVVCQQRYTWSLLMMHSSLDFSPRSTNSAAA